MLTPLPGGGRGWGRGPRDERPPAPTDEGSHTEEAVLAWRTGSELGEWDAPIWLQEEHFGGGQGQRMEARTCQHGETSDKAALVLGGPLGTGS